MQISIKNFRPNHFIGNIQLNPTRKSSYKCLINKIWKITGRNDNSMCRPLLNLFKKYGHNSSHLSNIAINGAKAGN